MLYYFISTLNVIFFQPGLVATLVPVDDQKVNILDT